MYFTVNLCIRCGYKYQNDDNLSEEEDDTVRRQLSSVLSPLRHSTSAVATAAVSDCSCHASAKSAFRSCQNTHTPRVKDVVYNIYATCEEFYIRDKIEAVNTTDLCIVCRNVLTLPASHSSVPCTTHFIP